MGDGLMYDTVLSQHFSSGSEMVYNGVCKSFWFHGPLTNSH